MAKVRWAVHDHSKFQTMISDLKELIDGLMDITPSIQPPAREMVQADINSLSNLESVRLVQEACADSHGDWSDAASLRMEASEAGILEWRDTVSSAQRKASDARVITGASYSGAFVPLFLTPHEY